MTKKATHKQLRQEVQRPRKQGKLICGTPLGPRGLPGNKRKPANYREALSQAISQHSVSGEPAASLAGTKIIHRKYHPAGNARERLKALEWVERYKGSQYPEIRALALSLERWRGDLETITSCVDAAASRGREEANMRDSTGDSTGMESATYGSVSKIWDLLTPSELSPLLLARLRSLLPYLPEKDQLFVLWHLKGLNQNEIAELYSPNYFQSSVSHAMRQAVARLTWLDRTVGADWRIPVEDLPRPDGKGRGQSSVLMAAGAPAVVDAYLMHQSTLAVSKQYGCGQASVSNFLYGVRTWLHAHGRSDDAELLDPRQNGVMTMTTYGQHEFNDRHRSILCNLLNLFELGQLTSERV